MNYFFAPHVKSVHSTIELSQEESNHAVKILRLREAQLIQLLNGRGRAFSAEITNAHPKRLQANILEITEENSEKPTRHIGLAYLKKRDKLEWFLEKAVELGAASVIFFDSEHTEKSNVNLERLQKIAVSALKQSGNLWLPEIKTFTFQDIIKQDIEQKLIAHCKTADQQFIGNIYRKAQSTLILIGPEGDFSDEEVCQAVSEGFRSLNLGELRLRAETAAVTALVQSQLLERLHSRSEIILKTNG